MNSFKIGNTEFSTGDIQFSIEKSLLSLEVNGNKDVFDKLTEDYDSEWSFALYPPKFYLYDIPYEDKKIMIDEDFSYKYDVSLYMMEYNDFIGTLEITDKSINIQGQVDIMGDVLSISIILEK